MLGFAVDNAVTDDGLQPARLTVDLLRPVALEPVQVQTSVRRSGRRLHLLDATMVQHGVEVGRASALYLRRGDQPPGDRWTTPVTMPPLPPDPPDLDDEVKTLVWTYGKDGKTPSRGLGAWAYDGPKHMWVRDLIPLVDGVTLTPFTRAAMAGDMASSLTHFGADGLPFINADYTLALSRLRRSEYLGLAALTHHSDDGVATGTAVLVDTDGPIGTATATALANPGFAPSRSIG
ncbi:hypothetical protein MDUV_42160 [Mycolicibacterium duvalii]|uniref:Thioesterase n=1 Tax=Mycolicibacterium duvalii TaxID=39688 RepID=A0A7I7K5G3_9MYCO|nr:hypothetical protein MDUV_42160 [Mycolicibacterium duvalii]